MGFPILVRRHLYIESGPWHCHQQPPYSLTIDNSVTWITLHTIDNCIQLSNKKFLREVGKPLIYLLHYVADSHSRWSFSMLIWGGLPQVVTPHSGRKFTMDLEGSVAVPIQLGRVSCNVGRSIFSRWKNPWKHNIKTNIQKQNGLTSSRHQAIAEQHYNFAELRCRQQ